jgi:hypothetical protein
MNNPVLPQIYKFTNLHMFHVHYPLALLDFNGTWIFSGYLKKYIQMPNFMKILPMEDELFHAGRADRHDKVNSRSRNFVTEPTNG